ncbi:hypothetical protein TCAL_17043 [Tigriopus californicus]|uniref:Mos1 transposase HTH domain-containing protein n=1 Tax=Tigriopus californicus TaxID=6832 RepID=A0A553PNI0_TIGCA|nr:hypothetical protein TCAL_17043 [Tigriopus californicus]
MENMVRQEQTEPIEVRLVVQMELSSYPHFEAIVDLARQVMEHGDSRIQKIYEVDSCLKFRNAKKVYSMSNCTAEEARSAIKVLHEDSHTVKDIAKRVDYNVKLVYKVFQHLKVSNGDASITVRSGRPVTATTAMTVRKVKEMARKNPIHNLRDISEVHQVSFASANRPGYCNSDHSGNLAKLNFLTALEHYFLLTNGGMCL